MTLADGGDGDDDDRGGHLPKMGIFSGKNAIHFYMEEYIWPHATLFLSPGVEERRRNRSSFGGGFLVFPAPPLLFDQTIPGAACFENFV